nr:glycine-rich protein [Clostridioides difficile]
MRLVNGDWNNEQGLLSRIIVAGGGGGAFSKTPAGKGGGFKGGNSTNDDNSSMLIVPGGTQYDGGRGYLMNGMVFLVVVEVLFLV